MSIIRRFSLIVPSLTRHLQSDFELVQSISGSLIYRSYLIVNLITALILNLQAITQSSKASTLLVTLLYLIKDQYIILALFVISINTRIQPICDKRSLLFINKASVNTSRRSILISSLIYVRPLTRLLIYHQSRLLSAIISLFLGLITQVVKERLKEALGWHIEVIYAPLTRCATYYSYIVSILRTISLKLIVIAILLRQTVFRFLHQCSQVIIILPS